LNRAPWAHNARGEMESKVQETLATAVQYVREMKAQRVANLRLYMAHAEGVVAGLESAGILTGREAGEWKKKVWAVGEAPAKRSARRPRPGPSTASPNLGFIKLVPGPRDPEPFLDGFMRIVAVELLQDRVRVHWTLYPVPSYAALLGDDLRRLDEDTEGLAGDAREQQRLTARVVRMWHLLKFSASDDLGTRYRHSRGGGSTGGAERGEQSGVADFQPAFPDGATSFVIHVHDATFDIPLGGGSVAE
jgi:hypothetical protein